MLQAFREMRLPDYFCEAIREVRQNGATSPPVLLRACIRFLQVVGRSSIGGAVDDRFADWARRAWAQALQPRFAFSTPSVTIPEIERALEGPGLVGVAQALLAAAMPLHVRLHASFREEILSLASAYTG